MPVPDSTSRPSSHKRRRDAQGRRGFFPRGESRGTQGGNRGALLCFDPIERDKNITHVFLDFGDCPVKDFRVFIKTESRGEEEVTDRLKTTGGPCKELDADYRLEVPGPDKKVKVCIIFKDHVTDDVRIGAKSANECRYEKKDDHLQAFAKNDCRKCK